MFLFQFAHFLMIDIFVLDSSPSSPVSAVGHLDNSGPGWVAC